VKWPRTSEITKEGDIMNLNLKARRIEKRMTQEELAQKSKISRQTIISIENDEQYNVTTNTLVSLADALGITVDQLFLP
jgi:DNA-binding XRE family transcriptional regulator